MPPNMPEKNPWADITDISSTQPVREHKIEEEAISTPEKKSNPIEDLKSLHEVYGEYVKKLKNTKTASSSGVSATVGEGDIKPITMADLDSLTESRGSRGDEGVPGTKKSTIKATFTGNPVIIENPSGAYNPYRSHSEIRRQSAIPQPTRREAMRGVWVALGNGGIYNVWQASDNRVYLDDPNRRDSPVFENIQTLMRILQDRYEDFVLLRDAYDTLEQYEIDKAELNEKYREVGNIPTMNFLPFLDEAHKKRKKKETDPPDPVDEEEEIIVNFEDLADFYARAEYKVSYKGIPLENNPVIYANLINKHKGIILSHKRNTNG